MLAVLNSFRCITRVSFLPIAPILQVRQLRPRHGKCLPAVLEPQTRLQSREAPCDCSPGVVVHLCRPYKGPGCVRSGFTHPARTGAVSKLTQASLFP